MLVSQLVSTKYLNTYFMLCDKDIAINVVKLYKAKLVCWKKCSGDHYVFSSDEVVYSLRPDCFYSLKTPQNITLFLARPSVLMSLLEPKLV